MIDVKFFYNDDTQEIKSMPSYLEEDEEIPQEIPGFVVCKMRSFWLALEQ